jgi:hypothetical protein
MTRFEMQEKALKYILSDQHKIEDYSDIEICCEEDINNALLQVGLKLTTSSD